MWIFPSGVSLPFIQKKSQAKFGKTAKNKSRLCIQIMDGYKNRLKALKTLPAGYSANQLVDLFGIKNLKSTAFTIR